MGQEAESEQSENHCHAGDVSARNARRVGDNTRVLKQVKNTEH
jgi:hypothetical protein